MTKDTASYTCEFCHESVPVHEGMDAIKHKLYCPRGGAKDYKCTDCGNPIVVRNGQTFQLGAEPLCPVCFSKGNVLTRISDEEIREAIWVACVKDKTVYGGGVVAQAQLKADKSKVESIRKETTERYAMYERRINELELDAHSVKGKTVND